MSEATSSSNSKLANAGVAYERLKAGVHPHTPSPVAPYSQQPLPDQLKLLWSRMTPAQQREAHNILHQGPDGTQVDAQAMQVTPQLGQEVTPVVHAEALKITPQLLQGPEPVVAAGVSMDVTRGAPRQNAGVALTA